LLEGVFIFKDAPRELSPKSSTPPNEGLKGSVVAVIHFKEENATDLSAEADVGREQGAEGCPRKP